MKNIDNNIELFDAYLNNTMSKAERDGFEKQLNDDADLRKAFRQHKEFVAYLQATCAEKDREFEQAIANISEEELRNITGKKSLSTQPQEEKPKGKMIPISSVYRWMSAAAVVLLLVGVGTNFYQKNQTQNLLCDAMVESYQFEAMHGASRGGETDETSMLRDEYNKAIAMINKNNTVEAISVLKKQFTAKSTPGDMKRDIGVALAYAYVKAHDVKNARLTIDELTKANGGETPEELVGLKKALDKL